MIRPIVLDILGGERRVPVAGVALLAAGVIAAAAFGWRFAVLRAEIADLGERIDAKRSSVPAPPSATAVRVAGVDAAADLRRAQIVLRQLGMPWNDLFSEIERAVDANVGLLGLQPELAAGRVSITAEAKDLNAALAFAERLNGGKVLSDAFLTAHEVRTQDAQRPVRFTVSARWAAGAAS